MKDKFQGRKMQHWKTKTNNDKKRHGLLAPFPLTLNRQVKQEEIK